MSMTRGLSLQITYKSGKPLAAYLSLDSNGKRAVARTEEVSPDLLVDYAADGSPLGLEILSPGTVTIERVWAVFDQLGLDRPPASELSPRPAA
jgi:uncharacterized protein YuzE